MPVGADNNELTGGVENIQYFLPENVPFPLERTKTIIRKASVDEIDYIGFTEVQDDEQQFIVLKDSSGIDVLDENLYCYDSTVFATVRYMFWN